MNKSNLIRFRCRPDERVRIENKARRAGKSTSEYCHKISIHGKVIEAPKLCHNELVTLSELRTFRNNFIRISNYIKNRSPELYQQIGITIEDINRVIKKIL